MRQQTEIAFTTIKLSTSPGSNTSPSFEIPINAISSSPPKILPLPFPFNIPLPPPSPKVDPNDPLAEVPCRANCVSVNTRQHLRHFILDRLERRRDDAASALLKIQ